MFSIANKFLSRLLCGGAVLATALMISGCGGSGAGATGGAQASLVGSTVNPPTSMVLLTSSTTAGTSGSDVVTITALVKDASNNAKVGVDVQFASTDSGIIIVPKSTKTDTAGKVEAEVTIIGKTVRTLSVVATAGALTSSTVIDVGTSPSTIASLTLLRSVPNATTSGKDTVTFTALIKDSSNNAKSGVLVSFSSSDPGLSIARQGDGKTDASGKAEAIVTFTGQTNRTVTIVASAENLVANTSIDVSGTRLSFVGPGTVVQGGTASYSIVLLDYAGQPIVDQAITVSSARGNTLVLSAPKTNSQGKLNLNVTTTQAGNDTLTASAAGAVATQTLAVSATDLQIVAPTQEYRVNTAEPVTVRMRQNNANAVGAVLRVSATRGVLSASSVTTDSNGLATFTINSLTAGLSTISVTSADGTVATLTNEFISTTPASLVLQPSPSIVGVNVVSTGEQQTSQLLAVVKDAAGNPVKNVRVDFTSVTDPSNGNIESPGFATTDSSGSASLGFRPGPNPTGTNEIVLRATVAGTVPINAQATLTAARQELDVELGMSRIVEPVGVTSYRMPWRVAITDSAGAPVSGVTLQAALVSTKFIKARWVFSGAIWSLAYPPLPATTADYFCPSEDLNVNGRLDAGEDRNLDGQLSPGAAATVYFDGTNTLRGETNSQGAATVWVEYARDKGWFVEAQLRVTATIRSGTESFGTRIFVLPLPSDVFGDSAATPNGLLGSPYGLAAGCDNTN